MRSRQGGSTPGRSPPTRADAMKHRQPRPCLWRHSRASYDRSRDGDSRKIRMHAVRSGQGASRQPLSLPWWRATALSRKERCRGDACVARKASVNRRDNTGDACVAPAIVHECTGRKSAGLRKFHTSLRSKRSLMSLRSERGLARLRGERGRSMRAAPAVTVRLARFPWLVALVAFAVCWAAPVAHADERNEPAAVTTAGAAVGEPAGASQTAPSGAASFAETSPALAKLLGLGEGIAIGGSNEDQFLDPDVAFVLNAVATGPGAMEARWDIAEGYYLYREKFRFRAADGSRASLGEAGFPEGMIKDDEYFGPMEVYYGSVAALVPVAGGAPGDVVDVDVTYQGCADAGLCYPPITKTVSLLLPAALADTGTGAGPGAGAAGLSDPGGAGAPSATPNVQARAVAGGASGESGLPGSGSVPGIPGLPRQGAAGAVPGASGLPISGTAGTVPGMPGLPGPVAADITPIEMPEQDRVAAALMSGNRWLVVLSLFGAGLLLTFTPCVLPMVPILTSIIVGRGEALGDGAASTRRAFALSLVYVLAMALTYTVAGSARRAVRREPRRGIPGPLDRVGVRAGVRAARALDVRVLRAPDAGLVAGRARRPQPSPARRDLGRGRGDGGPVGADRRPLRGGAARRGAHLHRPDGRSAARRGRAVRARDGHGGAAHRGRRLGRPAAAEGRRVDERGEGGVRRDAARGRDLPAGARGPRVGGAPAVGGAVHHVRDLHGRAGLAHACERRVEAAVEGRGTGHAGVRRPRHGGGGRWRRRPVPAAAGRCAGVG